MKTYVIKIIVMLIGILLMVSSIVTMVSISDLREEVVVLEISISQMEEERGIQQHEIASMGTLIDNFITDQMNEPQFEIDLGSWASLLSRIDTIERELTPPEDGEFTLREDFEYEGELSYIELHYSRINGIITLDYLDSCVEICETQQINQIFDESAGMTVEQWWDDYTTTYFALIDLFN